MPFIFTMPKLSPTMEEGTIAKWHKQEGDFVEANELLVDITTDKATVEHTTLDEGWLRVILVPEGSTTAINQPLAIFTQEKNEAIAPLPSAPPPTAAVPSPTVAHVSPLSQEQEERRRASPLARKLAKDKGVDLSLITGSGPGGRITSKDVHRSLAHPYSKPADSYSEAAYEERPLTPMRLAIARRLQEAKQTVPHFYMRQAIDAEALVALHAQCKAMGLSITINDILISTCAAALKQHPAMNVGYGNHTIKQFKTVDIAVAVTVDAGGILTPLIRHADYKTLHQIAAERKELVERARKGKLQEREYTGGSFCISNLGMYGVSEFTAIINPPHAAILAVGAVEEKPVVRNGAVVVGKQLILTLSADHRVVDGAALAAFVKTLQNILENPLSLLL